MGMTVNDVTIVCERNCDEDAFNHAIHVNGVRIVKKHFDFQLINGCAVLRHPKKFDKMSIIISPSHPSFQWELELEILEICFKSNNA